MEHSTQTWRCQSNPISTRLFVLLIGLAVLFVGHISAGANYFVSQATLVSEYKATSRVTLALERTRGLLSALGAEVLDRETAARNLSRLANLGHDIKASVRIWSPELRSSSEDDALELRMLKIGDMHVQHVTQKRLQDLSAWSERATLETERRDLQGHVEELLLRQSRKLANIDAMDANLSKAAFPMFALGCLGLCSGLILAVYVRSQLIKPLKNLLILATKISNREPVSVFYHINRRDEVGAIAQIVKLLQELNYRNIDLNKKLIAAERAKEKAAAHEASAVRRFESIIESLDCGVLHIGMNGEAIINSAYRNIYNIRELNSRAKLSEIVEHLAKKELSTPSYDPSAIAERMAVARRISYHTTLADGRTIGVKERPLPCGEWLSLHEDSTKRRTTERKLERAERLLGLIAENIGEAILARDPQSRLYVFANGAAENLLGIKRDFILGRNASEIIGLAAAERMEDTDGPFFGVSNIKTERQDVIETPANGSRRVVVRDLGMNASEGYPGYLVSVIRDVTNVGVTVEPITCSASG